jgi:hypothetical protein
MDRAYEGKETRQLVLALGFSGNLFTARSLRVFYHRSNWPPEACFGGGLV